MYGRIGRAQVKGIQSPRVARALLFHDAINRVNAFATHI
jgi:hypothetical protein